MRITILIFTFLFSFLVYGSDYKFERITSKDGLSQNNILDIYECSDGYLWFATYDGLDRYSGYDFEVYRNSAEDSNSISSNLIKAIDEDANGNLWIGTFNDGLCRFNKQTKQFTTYKNNEKHPDLLCSNAVRNLLCDSKNNLWLCSLSGLTYLEFNDKEVTKNLKIRKTSDHKSISYDVVFNVFEDSKGRIFVLNFEGIDLLIRSDSGEVQNKFYHITSGYHMKNFRSMLETKAGYVFNHLFGISLLKLNEQNPEESEIIIIDENYARDILIDKQNNLWTINNDGLRKFNYTPEKNIPYTFETHIKEGDGEEFLSYDDLRSISIDNAGILWIGTNGKGALKFNINRSRFRHYNKTKLEGSISANKIWCIYEDSNSNLWFGTEGGGLNLLPVTNKRNYKSGFESFRVNSEGTQDHAYQIVESKVKGKYGYIIGVGYPNKLISLRYKDSHSIIESHYSQIKSHVMAVCRDENNNIWLGTYGGGLYKDVSGGMFDNIVHFTTENSLLPSEIIRSITEDSKGRIWIGTDQGLVVVSSDQKKEKRPNFTVIRSVPGDSTSLSHNYIVPVVETSNGEIWIGTFGGGLNSYIEGTTETNGTFIRLDMEDGMPNNTIKQIVEDNMGSLWVTSNMGLSRINKNRKDIRNFTMSDGLQDVEFNDLAGTKLSDGEIILGGVNGFNAFYPEEISEDTLAPRLVFEDLFVMNKVVKIEEVVAGEVLLKKSLNNTEKITLKHFQHSFTIEFAALHYTTPDDNHYKYMLEGFDSDWVSTTSKARFARYTNISPGTYKFKFSASNCHGLWTETPKVLTIVVKPPFWKTWWFITLEIFILFGLLIFVFYWRTRNIRLHNIELAKEVSERTKDLKKSNIVLKEQTEILNDTNTVLEERQQQIEEQTEQLMAQKEELLLQRDTLFSKNKLLEERQCEIEEKTEELQAQKEELVIQRDKLKEVNLVKDRLFSIVAHDLRNPFSTLTGFLDLLHLRYAGLTEEKRILMVQQAKKSAHNIKNLLENLLVWSRSQQGTIRFKPEKKNIIALLANNIELVSGQAHEKNIEVKFMYTSPEIILNFDSDLINTVVRNILTNAIKYTSTDGTIIIQCEVKEAFLVISVIDNGIGISIENQKKLFNPGIHFTTAGTNSEKGTGLGLITANDFVKMHNGTLKVNSEEGKGTTFKVNLPFKSNLINT